MLLLNKNNLFIFTGYNFSYEDEYESTMNLEEVQVLSTSKNIELEFLEQLTLNYINFFLIISV